MASVNDLASAVVTMADSVVQEAKLQQAAELASMLQAQWKARSVGEVVNISDRSPFVPLPATASVWDALEQLGQGGAHSVVVMTDDEVTPEALFSQSALVAFLFHHLHHFSSIARKMVQQVANLALVGAPHPLRVSEDAPLLDAFRLIRDKGVTGVMVVQGRKLVGVISASDVRALGPNMEGCAHLFTSAGSFVRQVQGQNPLLLSKVVSCTPVDTVGMVMEKMLDNAVHRVFVVRTHHGMEVEVPLAVMTLRDVLLLFQPDA
jgi:CBS domain-containing protein